MNKYVFLIFLYFLLAWFFLWQFDLMDGQHHEFISWVEKNGTYDWYAYPFMRWIGEIGHNAIGDIFFIAFPFCLFFIALTFIVLTAKYFNQNFLLLFLVLFSASFGLRAVGFFTHDAPVFFLTSIFSYFYYKTVYSDQKHYFVLFLCTIGLLCLRETGVLFILFFIACFFKPKEIVLTLKPYFFGIFPITDGFSSLLGKVNPQNIFKFFTNPVFTLSFISILKKKDTHHFLLLFLTFVYVYSIANDPVYYGSTFRYTFSLVPMHLFYILKKEASAEEMTKPTIVDFFAGIGGIRIGFEREGFKCVYPNEINPFCAITYKKNFGDDPIGDITIINEKEMPNFDVFLGGFPCQSFSIAGKKLGFNDTRGTMFFHIARILKEKKPKAFLLENVKNLERHDKGNTLQVILNVLKNELNYNVSYKILNAKDFGVPQHRQRIYIVGFRKDVFDGTFEFPSGNGKVKLKDILEKNVPLKYFISKRRLVGMKRHKARHESKGNGFGYEVLDWNDAANAIVVGGMGRERNMVKDCASLEKHKEEPGFQDKNEDCIRYLTPRECARLQGFPDSFEIPVSNAQAYKQFANSVAVPVIGAIAKQMKKQLISRRVAVVPEGKIE